MSRVRVDFVSPPFRGHLHPILGLARAARAVADVRVVTTAGMLDEVSAAGLEGVGVMPGRDAEIEAIVSPPFPVRSHPLRLWRQFAATLGLLEDLTCEVEATWRTERPDLVIVDSVLPSVGYAAQRHGAVWWTSLASPCTIEPRRGTPGYLGGWSHRDDAWGRVRDAAGRLGVRTFKRLVFAAQRRRAARIGVARVYRENGDEAVYSPDRVLGLGMEELEFPREWPRAFRLIGPSLHTPPRSDVAVPRLDPGRLHVLATLGTHVPWAKDAMADRLRRAAAGQGRWVVHFSDGRPGAADREQDGATFQRHRYVDYACWLGAFDLVIHHGGAGVMYHAIREAKPALVYPLDYDQFDHAARLERAGVGRWLRSGDDLRAAIDRALDDTAMRAACRDMQAASRRYDAGAALVAMIEELRQARRAPRC